QRRTGGGEKQRLVAGVLGPIAFGIHPMRACEVATVTAREESAGEAHAADKLGDRKRKRRLASAARREISDADDGKRRAVRRCAREAPADQSTPERGRRPEQAGSHAGRGLIPPRWLAHRHRCVLAPSLSPPS